MRIIVEGPNNVGKSTFIDDMMRDIPELRKYHIEHTCSNCPNDYTYHKDLLMRDNTIFDRFYIGEQIYPELFNRDQKLSLDDAKYLFNLYNNTIIIFVDADISFIKQACDNKREKFDYHFSMSERRAFVHMYDVFKDIDKQRVFMLENHKDANYIYSEYSYATVMDSIMKFMEK